MMRSLWTAATGMSAQQLNIDTISNNLANVNTVGHKKERLEFKSLMYDTMERASLDAANADNRPVNLQVGHGVRAAATARIFDMGSIDTTNFPLDFAIAGNGFFVVDLGNGTTGFTKDGSLKISAEDDGNSLITSDGFYILGVDGERITFPPETLIDELNVSREGIVMVLDADGEDLDLGLQIDIVQFPNVQGLEAIGGNIFVETSASGLAIQESEGIVNNPSTLIQGALEMSNVLVADEMINLIVAQRAYELNSKAITTSDEMLQLANNLKR